jgi:hypothetical protein
MRFNHLPPGRYELKKMSNHTPCKGFENLSGNKYILTKNSDVQAPSTEAIVTCESSYNPVQYLKSTRNRRRLRIMEIIQLCCTQDGCRCQLRGGATSVGAKPLLLPCMDKKIIFAKDAETQQI